MQDYPVHRLAIAVIAVTSKAIRRLVKRRMKLETIHEKTGMH